MHTAYVCVFVSVCVYTQLLQLCPTLCDPMDHSLLGSSLHGMLQARILEGVATPFSRRSSQSRDQTRVSFVSCIGRQILYHCTAWEALIYIYVQLFATPRTAAHQVSLSFTTSQSLLKFMSHWVGDATQPSHPLLPLSPPARYNLLLFFSFGNPEKENMWWRTEKKWILVIRWLNMVNGFSLRTFLPLCDCAEVGAAYEIR